MTGVVLSAVNISRIMDGPNSKPLHYKILHKMIPVQERAIWCAHNSAYIAGLSDVPLRIPEIELACYLKIYRL